MDRKEAEKKIQELRAVLWENSRRYYVENSPVIGDYEYDHLMYQLRDLENEWPDLITPDSPTQRVGSDLASDYDRSGEEAGSDSRFPKVQHCYPMLSLSNTYSIEDVEEFASRAEKALDHDFTWCCELKFDGTGISLTYVDGILVKALTRGDGTTGDDATVDGDDVFNNAVSGISRNKGERAVKKRGHTSIKPCHRTPLALSSSRAAPIFQLSTRRLTISRSSAAAVAACAGLETGCPGTSCMVPALTAAS